MSGRAGREDVMIEIFISYSSLMKDFICDISITSRDCIGKQ